MRQPTPFGKYLLLERVSVGGMAEVFKAKSFGVEGFEKIVAIKRILPSMAEDEEFIRMFIDEAKISGQLNHANIGQIFELGRQGDAHFIALEFVWGKDLLQVQNRFRKLKRAMAPAQAAFTAAKICEGLDYAHRKKDQFGRPLGIIHRDVSPQNILISYEGEVKLIDFGIAKAASRSQATQAGVLKGKFGYMSPEQVRGLPLDRRSDVFAIGTVLWEMLANDRLFLAESDFSTLEKVRNAEVLPLRQRVPHVPESLERIVLRALTREVEARYQWASEIQEDLQAFLATQEPIYTAKTLSAWMKEAFSQELAREQASFEEYKQVGAEARTLPPAPPPPRGVTPLPPPPSRRAASSSLPLAKASASPSTGAARSPASPQAASRATIIEETLEEIDENDLEEEEEGEEEEALDGKTMIGGPAMLDAETPTPSLSPARVSADRPFSDQSTVILDASPAGAIAGEATHILAAGQSPLLHQQSTRIIGPDDPSLRPPGASRPTPFAASGPSASVQVEPQLAAAMGGASSPVPGSPPMRPPSYVTPTAAVEAAPPGGASGSAVAVPALRTRRAGLIRDALLGLGVAVVVVVAALAGRAFFASQAVHLGGLEITASPPTAAEVYVDGVSLGRLPAGGTLSIDDLACGNHAIELRPDTLARVQLAVTVVEGARTPVRAAFPVPPPPPPAAASAPAGPPGFLLASSEPGGAELWIDGVDSGKTTPISAGERISVGPGAHMVRLVLGGRHWDYQVSITSGQEATLVSELR